MPGDELFSLLTFTFSKVMGLVARDDEERCGYTVHANGEWGDYRCELTHDHEGSHLVGLMSHLLNEDDVRSMMESCEP
jgi:hypothetical protein